MCLCETTTGNKTIFCRNNTLDIFRPRVFASKFMETGFALLLYATFYSLSPLLHTASLFDKPLACPKCFFEPRSSLPVLFCFLMINDASQAVFPDFHHKERLSFVRSRNGSSQLHLSAASAVRCFPSTPAKHAEGRRLVIGPTVA